MSSKDSRTVRSGGKLRDNIKELPIAIICAGYGLYELAVEAFLKMQMAKAIGIAVFGVGIVWFLTQLSKAKKKYM